MSVRPLTVAALAFVGWVCACSSSSTTPTPDGGRTDGMANKDAATKEAARDAGPTLAEACMARANAICALLNNCSPARLQFDYGTTSTCFAGVQATCLNTLSAPSTGNSPEITENCAQAYPAYDCTDFLNNENPPMPCAQVKGTLGMGKACAFPGQCQSGFCAIPPTSACGVCAPMPIAGDSCANLTTCGVGLFCEATTKTCVVFGTSGGTCSSTAPCGTGLSCVAADGGPGTCQAAVATQGQTCDPTLQTGPGCSFDKGLECNSTSAQCEPITFAAGGQPCGVISGQFVRCAAGGICSTTATDAGKVCVAAAATDGTCDIAGPGCIEPERCIGATEGGVSGKCQIDNSSTCN
jgi:hypothetical protein